MYAAGNLFLIWPVSDQVSTPYVFAGSTHELPTFLFKSVLEDVAVLGERCPSGRYSSLNLRVLVVASGVVSVSKVDVAVNVPSLSGVDILLCRHHFCLRFVHRQTQSFTFIS